MPRQLSLRGLLIAFAALCGLLAQFQAYSQSKGRERAAAAHLVARHHAAPLRGPRCPWPLARVLGEDFFQHVDSIQMWNYRADSVAAAAELPYLRHVHIWEDESFRSGELHEGSFASLRGHAALEELYIRAPLEDALLEHFFAARLRRLVLYRTRIAGPGLTHIRPDRLETVTLFRSPINDQAMRQVGGFYALRNLLIHGTDVTSEGLWQLQRLPRLETLVLVDLDLDDEAFRLLPRSLKRLYVRDVPITDRALADLGRGSLRQLHLIGTQVSAQGIERLRAMLPNCGYRLTPPQGVPRTAAPLPYDTVFLAHPGTNDRDFTTLRYGALD